MSISIQIDGDEKAFKALRIVNVGAARKVAGRSLVNLLRSHFRSLDSERPNHLGGKRTHFYAQVARSIQQPEIEGDVVKVSINQVGLAQRLLGGTITPKNSKWLTIPIVPEAYGRRAREFNDLEVVFDRNGRPIGLAQRAQSRLKGSRAKKGQAPEQVGGKLFYLLLKSVTQKPDPSVLPTEEEIGAKVSEDLNDYFQALIHKK